MELPKTLTSVTPFSKFLALVFFIMLPFLGFFFGMAYQKQLDQSLPEVVPQEYSYPSPTPTPTNSANTATKSATLTPTKQATISNFKSSD